MKNLISKVVAGLLFANLTAGFAADHSVAYPEGYRNWLHTKSMLIQPGHALENPFQGLHHIYANKKAESGLQSGLQSGKYQDGSVLVFNLLQYQEKDKTIQEGERKLLGVMVKDAKKYPATGGWGFEGFAGNSKTERLVKDNGAGCFACHASEQKSDYVFSQYRP